MYKTRFRVWKLKKNFKKEDYETARKTLDVRTDQGLGLATEVAVKGRQIPLHRLKRRFRADPTFARTFQKSNLWLDAGVMRHQLQPSTAEHQVELMLHEINAHWSVTIGRNESIAVMKAKRVAMNVNSHPNDVRNRLLEGLALVRRGKFYNGWREINYVCDEIGKVFKLEEPNLLREIVATFTSVVWKDHDDLFDRITRHFALMAEVYLGPQHPLTKILKIMASSAKNLDVLHHFAERAFRLMMKVLEDNRGAVLIHRRHRIMLQTEIISQMQHHLPSAECRSIIQTRLSRYKHDLGPKSIHTLNLAFLLGTMYEKEKDFEDNAEAEYLWITEQGRKLAQDSRRIGSYSLAARRLGQMYFRRAVFAKSQEYYSLAWVWTAGKFGDDHPFTELVIREFGDLQLIKKKMGFDTVRVRRNGTRAVVVAENDEGEITVVDEVDGLDEVDDVQDGLRGTAADRESDGMLWPCNEQHLTTPRPDTNMEVDGDYMDLDAGVGDEGYLHDVEWEYEFSQEY